MSNKAHAAVVRRIAQRYGPCLTPSNGFDVVAEGLIVEVETSATLGAGIERLIAATGKRYVAVTNQEAIDDALRATELTEIGVMGPWGDVVRETGPIQASNGHTARSA